MQRSLRLIVLLVFLSLTVQPSSAQPALPLTYRSPNPSAQHVSLGTSIAVRQGEPLDAERVSSDLFTVVGSKSGRHTGTARLSDDKRTVLFYPDQPFVYNETVSVSVAPGLRTASGTAVAGTVFQFTTLQRPVGDVAMPRSEPYPETTNTDSAAAPQAETPRYVTHPETYDLPNVTVKTPANGTGEGLIFLTSLDIPNVAGPYLMIIDDKAEPVFIRKMPEKTYNGDFKVQTINGQPVLTFHHGLFQGGWSYGESYVLDQTYNHSDVWQMGNGIISDLHDFQLLPNGHALMMAYVPYPEDLTPYGGPADGIIVDAVIQELDSNKNVVFEWRASDHIPYTDSYWPMYASPVDYVHINAIELDDDGNLLISSRHLDEITKINRDTGAIMWRLGGKQNQFTFTDNDEGFSHQHDIRRLPNGNITIYDNGNRRQPSYTRVVEYDLDEVNKVARRVWQYRENPDIFAAFSGNAQRLSNGNTMIGWGGLPTITEVKPDGTKALELSLNGEFTYRAYRFPWSALPTTQPRVAAVPANDPSAVTLYFSWNGATNIQSYDVYAGATPDTMSKVDTVTRTGFETSTTLTGLDQNTCVFKVQPIHSHGLETPFSHNAYWLDRPECRALLTNTVFLPLVAH